ncbi:MAG: type II toxin-antitoxin system VapC family toxin [Thermodesulfovibrionales bacterium]
MHRLSGGKVSNAVWKRKELPVEIAERLINDIWDFNVYEPQPQKWVKDAFMISKRYGIPFYDSSYIAMAKILNLSLWTLDKSQSNVALKVGVKLW